MDWLALFAAGVFEVVWSVALKYSHGFRVLVPSLVTAAAMAASFALLSMALRSLPMGTVYAVWTGIGTLGTFLIGAFFLGEALTVARVVFVGFIVAGVAGLRLTA
jgi:quaternary ammonium compound-resistance protein SugE